MNNIIFEYPLKWLPQQKRTKNMHRARFSGKHSLYNSGNNLVGELQRMKAKNCVITSNLKVKLNGSGFYSNQKVDDPGIVVYFQLQGKSKAIACDKWDRPEHNIWALYLTINSIRGLERWGGSELLDGLFDGFKALPSPEDVTTSGINYFADTNTEQEIVQRYRDLAKTLHPDKGGDVIKFREMTKQYNILKSRI